jgi:hypothetical protein
LWTNSLISPRSSLPLGNSCGVPASLIRFPISFTSRPIATSPSLSHNEFWKRVDERLIKRSMLIIDLGFVKNYQEELLKNGQEEEGKAFQDS